MQSAVQNIVDTRAVEIASEARAEAKIAHEACERDYRRLSDEVALLRNGVDSKFEALRTSLSVEFSNLRTEAHKGRGAIYNLLWAAVGGIILILVAIIGFLFVVAYPPVGGNAVHRTLASAAQFWWPL